VQAFCAYTPGTPRVHFDTSLNPIPPEDWNHAEPLEFQDTTSLLASPQDLLHAHHHFGHVGFCDIQQWAQDGKYCLVIIVPCFVLPVNMGKPARSLIHLQLEALPSMLPLLVPLFLLIIWSLAQVVIYHFMLVKHCCISTSIALSGQSLKQVLVWSLTRLANTHETIQSKEDFESLTSCYDVCIKHINSDNGDFASADLLSTLMLVHKVTCFVASVLIGRMVLLNDILVLL